MEEFKNELIQLIKKHISADFELTIPPSSELGDYALPCFPFAKILKKDPVSIANELKEKINAEFIEKIEVKGAYLNFFISKSKLTERIIEKVLKEQECYGSFKQTNKKIMVEFSQANTHKAFHVGHVRGTSLGESLAIILEFDGNEVIRANYQGDTGMHVAKWVWCYKKYHYKEKLKEDEAWIAGIYVDAIKRLSENQEFQAEVDEINRKLEVREDKELNKLWKKTRKLCLNSLEKIYKELNTRFDEYFFESQVEKRGKEISGELVKKGIAAISDGAIIIDLKEYNLGVWVLLRKDGTVLYSAKDVALAEEKFSKYKIDASIYVVGKEQEHHFHQLFKTLELIKFKQAKKCYYVPVSLVKLPWGKMSSRTGDNILYSQFKEELLEAATEEIKSRFKLNEKELEERALAVAIAAMKYSMLKQHPNKEIIFDKKEAMRFEGDSGPYLLYSYARAASIIRKAGSSKKSVTALKLSEKEISLIKRIDEFNEKVHQSAENLNPSIIANYAFKLAQAFNEFYVTCKVIGSEEEAFRLKIVGAFRITLKNALTLLGINVVERM